MLPGGPCPDVLPVTYATGDLNHDGVDCADVAIVKAAAAKSWVRPASMRAQI